ncbi:ING1 PHD finger-like protein [Hamiltosporidium tvaerminnensis]|uniref:ING1 PHD finger-like protein n=2 Tax=Hamiltosporidium TaxID=1176354 RepID=A0A4Q9LFE6_9MICR|nr:ING1 PHD finger-like protein [Hamiltosporidium tvaerminnensis]TBU06664.1 ING1 PHD finger-like protein [Hamiltosporidium magnivora]TBU08898.1 ING1 PHD finger-like protein [Hamiltosporidium magnivora]
MSKTPYETYDSILTEIQSFPLDFQHHSKKIIEIEKICSKLKLKISKKTKILLKKPNPILLKKIKKYTLRIVKLIDKRIKITKEISEITKKYLNIIENKMSTNGVENDNLPTLQQNISSVIKAGTFQNSDKNKKKKYCTCKMPSYGDMICCDSLECKIKWFHFECVGIVTAPKSKWYCNACKDK